MSSFSSYRNNNVVVYLMQQAAALSNIVIMRILKVYRQLNSLWLGR